MDNLDKQLYGNNLRNVYGPYRRADARAHVILYYEDYTKITLSYPKYLMERQLERKLVLDEEVHHKDENFINDDLSNLEVVIKIPHIKSHRKVTKITSCKCGIEFMQKRKEQKYCSIQCRCDYTVTHK